MGDPERQPVSPLPFPAAGVLVEELGVAELAPGVGWLPGDWFGLAEFGAAVSGEV
jgi:hypothetical protein